MLMNGIIEQTMKPIRSFLKDPNAFFQHPVGIAKPSLDWSPGVPRSSDVQERSF